MSSDSSDSGDNAKVYRLRSKKTFPIWKQKIISAASSRGFEQFLQKDMPVKTQDELDTIETNYINETDDAQRRKLKAELSKHKRERRRSLAAADLITSNVKDKDLKPLAKCKLNPKQMFDTLIKKYENNEDEDIDDLLEEFKECRLKSRKKDPEDWYVEIDELNEQLGEIDSDFKKSEKEMAAHVLSNLPRRGYNNLKDMIKMNDNYLNDLDKVKKQVSKHWKSKHRKKKGKYDSSSSESEDDSSSDSSYEERSKRKRKKKRDLYALNINKEKADTRNEYGMIVCGHCKKIGHGIANCWELHGKPANYTSRGGNNTRQPRRCWICNNTEHLAKDCPKKNEGADNNNEEEQINNLFIGALWKCKTTFKKVKLRLNAYETEMSKNATCKIVKEHKEYKSEMSWCNIDSDVSSSDDDSNYSHMSWCKMCSGEESADDDKSDGSVMKRNFEKECELKKVLKMNTKTNKVEINDNSEMKKKHKNIEYTSYVTKEMKNKDEANKRPKTAKEEDVLHTIMVITCFDNDELENEEEGKESEEKNDENRIEEEEKENDVDREKESKVNDVKEESNEVIDDENKRTIKEVNDSDNQGLGDARRMDNSKGTDNLDHEDYYYDDKGIKMVRKIATEEEATALIEKYHGDLNAMEKESENYKQWREEQEKKGAVFTPQPWDDNYGDYDKDTDDSEEMAKRMAKRDLYNKPPLQQLFHRYVPANDGEIDNNEESSKDAEQEDPKEKDKSTKGNSNNKEEPAKYVGQIYHRDPYETDTDQSVGSEDESMNANKRYMKNRFNNMTEEEFIDFAQFMANENDLDDDDDLHDEMENIVDSTHEEAKEIERDDERNNVNDMERHDDEDSDGVPNETKSSDDGVNMIYEELHIMHKEDDWETWLGDTGASCHVSQSNNRIFNESSGKNDRVVVGDNRKCEVKMKGDLNLITKANEKVHLNSVRIVEEIEKNIISIGKLLKEGWTLQGSHKKMILQYNECKLKFKRNDVDGLYYTKLRRVNVKQEQKCEQVYNMNDDNAQQEWKLVENKDKKKWPKMSREEAHASWGHPHLNQLNEMGKFYKINLTGKLPACSGCGVVKSRTKATTRTCSKLAMNNGERIFIDTTGPYPKSRGGMRYWMCAVDDKSDKTWTYFTTAKKHMIKFVKKIVILINGKELKVKFIRCDNAGEHQNELIEYCNQTGITLEYTAPNTPKQNGRAEKKIHVIWARAMTMMVHANLTLESQRKFWAEAVACSNWIEDLTIKAGRTEPALLSWTHVSIHKWLKALIQFGRLGIVHKSKKLSNKMKDKGYPAMMVGYAHNHGPGTYKMYNPKTNRIVMSRDIKWMDFKPKQIESSFDFFEPGVESISTKHEAWNGENNEIDNSSISSHESEQSTETLEDEVQSREKNTKRNNNDMKKKIKYIEVPTSTSSSTSTPMNKSSSSSESSSASESSSSTSSNSSKSKQSNLSKISSPRATKRRASKGSITVRNRRKSKVPVPTVSVRTPRTKSRAHKMTTRSSGIPTGGSLQSNKRGKKVVTGDTTVRRIHIFTTQDEGEDEEENVNLVSEHDNDTVESSNTEYIFTISENTINKLYQGLQSDEPTYQQLYTMELMNDPNTPTTIKQALSSKDKELWRKSAIAEVNNFLSRKSWKFILKSVVQALRRKLIGVKWVFKIKHEPDFSYRFKSRVVSKGYMQIPGVDYTEKFSPVAQASSVRMVLAIVLWLHWRCELVDVEAAFLEGRLKTPTYIELPPGLVELGFMTQEEYDKTCIMLQGGMYGNVDAALLYFIRFTTFATSEEGLGLEQSKTDPCIFFKRNERGQTIGIIIIYVDDCLIAGDETFITNMKYKLKQEFGTVEDGQLRKLLGVRYKWEYLDDPDKAKVTLNMDDKADDIIQAYEKSTGITAKEYKSPGKPGELLEKHEGNPVMHDKYRSILGKLMFYVTKVSPECSFSCGQLARQMHNPGESHWNAMNRMIGYLKYKKKHELVIKRPKSMKIISFGDASYCDCKDTRRSSTGDIHTLGGSIISWRAQKTKSICLSSTESEYIALTEMCKEQRFLSMLLEEVMNVKDLPNVLYEDNEAAIYLAKNKHVSARTKHIDIKQHYVREHIQSGLGEIVGIKSEENFADILTKNVSLSVFDKLSEGILNGFEGHDDKFQFSKYQRENI